MFNGSDGKLLIYASSFTSHGNRLRQVSMAADRMARQLKTTVEIKMQRKWFTSIYVYYKSGKEAPVPIYCNNDGRSDMQEVYATLRNMMFVLSFHPKHISLKRMRSEIKQFS